MAKKILIIDDEIELAEFVHFFLAMKGYEGDFCTSPAEALKLFNSKPYDLILSDIKMPEQSGIEFYESLKSEIKEKKIGFILMTGFVDSITMQNAYDLGVDEFILKPFDVEDLKIVVDLVLLQVNHTHSQHKFYSVPLAEYIQSSTNNFDIYLYIADNYMCLAKKGQELSSTRLQNYYKKGLKNIFLTDRDYAKYIDMQCVISTSIQAKPIEKLKKIKLYTHFVKTISSSAFNDMMNQEIFQKTMISFENYSKVVFENEDIFKLLQSINSDEDNLTAHAARVAFLATAVATHWKWTHPRVLSKITMGALLCEVGLKDNPELFFKKRHEFTASDVKSYEDHPNRSHTILSTIRNIPDEVLKIALQHHENEAGLGFPAGLTIDKQHPYSRLIHAVIEFFDHAGTLNSREQIQQAVKKLYDHQRDTVSEQVLKTLYILFQLEVPNDLASIQLPLETSRMT